ncbi:MAG: GntR family transcriptional regulator [Sulfobacillus benefaciens]|uniref:GntR family transcriptional regulator n=1 Tax=Sulfobacillus benefaciens TaxID=453960 RepID=A0A2T2XIQ6_9FIRM|nr:MAG: GntR family transcriptional regulator [Sulfobacillus benefaciens]
MSTQGIARHFVSQQMYQLIRDQILTGELAPGTVLKDQQLANQYSVSRTPVREALLRLESENLVTTKPNRWTQVTPLNIDAVKDSYPIIWSLESLAVRLAPVSLSPRQLQLLSDANAALARALRQHHAVEATQMDLKFHRLIVESSGNHELTKVIEQIKTPLQRIEIAYFDRLFLSDPSVAEHENIIEAFKQHNRNLAIMAIEANWQNSLSRLSKLIENNSDKDVT